jgi:hypothetical protein
VSESLLLTAAVAVAVPRLRAYLNAPVTPASAWSPRQWAAVAGGRRGELPAAIAECDRWIDGDAATLFRTLADDDELLFRFDEATGSLAVDVSCRVDFRLPSLIWACTVLRGLAGFMAGDDRGIVTVTTDWSDDSILMRLAPEHSAFLGRDARARAEARSWGIDVRAAACDADEDATPAEVIDRLAGG